MHSRKTIAALAVAGGLITPAVLTATPAAAAAASCRVTLYDIDAGSVADRDGRDELRFRVEGNLFPRFDAKYYPMRAGGDGDPADFEHPVAIISRHDDVRFSLRETEGPAWGAGDNLGSVVARGSTCAGLDRNETEIVTETLAGRQPTRYEYVVRIKLTGL
ncbi:hypothetical protein [Nonomuraea sp. SYSU D8015]|uniref:hypothetical protein n=1 Tax=Nonomuraea sp. SYSU D8015 TaxID=2593644 RepID=UPI0016603439|nr:hypothetical protein [Nonomuraea sp. SYSU D8015]